MNKKNLIMAILLVFVVILSASAVSAENSADAYSLQESDNIATTSEVDEDIISSTQTIAVGSDSDTIQTKINSLSDGDTLNFETGEYTDICIYVNKNITINGNGATLIGYDTPSKDNTPSIIWNSTASGGYAIANLATLYIINTDGVVINGLNIVGGINSADTYSNALVYATRSNNLIFENNTLDGSSWGLYLQYCNDGVISENTIKNQKVTGILNFGSARTVIENNKIINAENHGIDVRHGTGPNVQVINNTVIGSKEGIYLMHSAGHGVYNNTLINCTISSISCYGSSNIDIRDNKMQKSRIGVLLGGGYKNINIGENTFALDNLPFPPTFVYYVAEAKSDYQSAENMMGTFSDSSSNDPNYIAYTEIDAPNDISIDYNTILKKTGTQYNVPEGYTNDQIQTMINSMNDGDTLIFAKNAIYTNISIYTDKNIKIIGNNATLIGFNNIDLANVPEKVRTSTSAGGYAIAYRSVLYVINSTGAVVSNLNIIAQYPGYDTTKATTTTDEYKTAGIYASENKNLVITGCDVTGASWGIFEQYSSDSIISRNNVHDIYTTGIMNFGSPNAIIIENTISDAVNHGIDTRHGTGPNVTIAFNEITGSKEGIYLMHSKGHTVYNNTIKDSKISGITALGSGNEKLFNNSISGSRIGILLSQGYYNVTIGENYYDLDFLPFPPTFVTYLARAESMYQSSDDVMRIYSDKETVTIIADDIETKQYVGQLNFTLVDQNGNVMANKDVTVTIGDVINTVKTDSEGSASIDLNLTAGNYTAEINYAGNDNYAETTKTVSIIVTGKINTILSASNITVAYNNPNGELVATIVNEHGEPIVVNLNVELNGKTYTVGTNSNGQASIPIGTLNPGTYTATISYEGNETYKASTTTAKVTVTKANTSIVAVYDNVSGELSATLTNVATGKGISGANVVVSLNGETYTLKTNGKGQASLSVVDLAPGVYTASVSYKGNSKYNPASTDVVVNTKTDTSIVAAYDNGELSATLTNAVTGKGLSGANVIVSLAGANYTLKTNGKGKAVLSVADLTPGIYTASVSYKGNSKYNPASTDVTVTVKADTSIVAVYDNVSGQLLVTLTNFATGKGLSGANVVVSLNGETYTLKTNGKGQAPLSTTDLASTTYTATFSYKGNSKYNPASTNLTFKNKFGTSISAIYDKAAGQLVANLTSTATGKGLIGATVVVNLNGADYTLKTNGKGQVTLSTADLATGIYTASISYKGNSKYYATSTEVIVNTKVDTSISAVYDSASGELSATLTNVATGKGISGARVVVSLAGESYTLTTNGKGQATLSTDGLNPGDYTASVSYKGNSKYNPTNATADVAIE